MESESPHGILIFQGGHLVYANRRAAEMAARSPEEMRAFTKEDLFSLAHPDDQGRLRELWQAVKTGDLVQPALNVCLQRADGGAEGGDYGVCHWVDVLINRVVYQGGEATQVNWIDSSPRRETEESLRQHIRRLQALHDIEHAILSVQEEAAAARAALRNIPYLVPDYRASSVVLVDQAGDQASPLAIDLDGVVPEAILERRFTLEDLAVDLEALGDGLPYVVHDLELWPDLKPLQAEMLAAGIRSYLSVPLRWVGDLIGTLNLASSAPHAFGVEHVQIAQEVADSLAVAIQQARLRKADEQRRREAEVMRDVMVALASAGNLQQTLEALLVNLHNVIHYDRAGLFLVDEEERYEMAGGDVPGEGAPRTYLEDDPVVVELRRTRRPIVVEDAHADPRLAEWPDMGSVRGWMGAPLLAGDEMIGFLTLGSLQVGAYSQADVALMQGFAFQVAEVVERAWLYEQSHRRTEELEVLSSISFALGQAESSENTLFAIVEQIARFFGASRGAFLAPERGGAALAIKTSLDESTIGRMFPQEDDLLWRALAAGRTQTIPDLGAPHRDHRGEMYAMLFPQTGSAVIIPLKADETPFGLLCFAFPRRQWFSQEKLRLYDAVAEIAAASLQRAVVLEALERQIKVRTQHLSTLYRINAVASEPMDLESVLEEVLEITLGAMKSSVGAIHFLEETGKELYLAAQRNIPLETSASFETLSLEVGFWRDLMRSSSPLVLAASSAAEGAPPELARLGGQGAPAYIGVPIRAKGQVLGLLSVFGETMMDYSAEDITLFMTIADQIGGMVERARLMRQAGLAAVVEERQRLARELHDSVTQLLYGQVLFSGAGLKVLSQGNLDLAEGHLARIDQAALQALKEMRLLVYQLRPSDTLDEGLVSALERRLESVERRTGIDARLTLEGDPDLDEAAEMALYRVAEEALNNTLKHAGARSVQVSIRAAGGKTVLEIADDGCGFDVSAGSQSGGMGLSNMRERVAALGGELQIVSQPGQGTHIILELEVSE